LDILDSNLYCSVIDHNTHINCLSKKERAIKIARRNFKSLYSALANNKYQPLCSSARKRQSLRHIQNRPAMDCWLSPVRCPKLHTSCAQREARAVDMDIVLTDYKLNIPKLTSVTFACQNQKIILIWQRWVSSLLNFCPSFY